MQVVGGEAGAEQDVPRIEPLPGEGLFALARRLAVDDLVVSLADRRGTLPTDQLLRCRLGGLNVEEGEALYERLTGKIAVEAMRPSYLIFNQGFRRHPLSEASKRAFDIGCALVGLLLLWPLMLLTALAVRLDSPGPILYRQERTGRFGKAVVVNKFRSMRADAERQSGPVWAQKNDPRITRVGRFIRKTRLDELPQLFNVLGGSMSMVGPRPERQHFIDDLMKQIPYYDQRHIVKPGLTGWAQINYPYGNTVEDALQKLQYDLFYIKNRSLPFDLSIVIQTIRTVALRQGT
jgi:sugar transferase (PEP-CTERM system associated)